MVKINIGEKADERRRKQYASYVYNGTHWILRDKIGVWGMICTDEPVQFEDDGLMSDDDNTMKLLNQLIEKPKIHQWSLSGKELKDVIRTAKQNECVGFDFDNYEILIADPDELVEKGFDFVYGKDILKVINTFSGVHTATIEWLDTHNKAPIMLITARDKNDATLWRGFFPPRVLDNRIA